VSDVDIKSYIDQRLHDLESRLAEQRSDLSARLAGMNEIREAMRDQAASMATRDHLDEVKERIVDLRMHAASVSAVVAVVVSVVIAVVAAFLLKLAP
jgi:uncharacterized coiled-coil protein SlyX